MGDYKNYSFRADKELTEMIEKFSEEREYSKASLFKMSVKTFIQQQKAMDELPEKAKETIDIIKKIEKMLGQEKNKYGLNEIKKQK